MPSEPEERLSQERWPTEVILRILRSIPYEDLPLTFAEDPSVWDYVLEMLCRFEAADKESERLRREVAKPTVMLEVGVEGDLFRPHPWHTSCVGSGCVRMPEGWEDGR